MKLAKSLCLLVGLFISLVTFAQKQGANGGGMKSELDTVSRALGLSVAKNIIEAGIDTLSMQQFMEGVAIAYAKKATQQDFNQAQQTIDLYVQELVEQQAEVKSKAGLDFLAANAQKEGVITTATGLQYKVIKAGTGPKPEVTDKVTTHYAGTLIDGKVFDSSIARGEPATFPVNGVIKGWTEALMMMNEGSTWQLFIPYELAYGPQGRPGIPPYAVLIFEVQLIDVIGK